MKMPSNLTKKDLAVIVRTADKEFKKTRKHRVFVEYRGMRYKVRRYGNPEESQRQLEIANHAKNFCSAVLGRIDEKLILEYAEGERIEIGREFCQGTGKLLGRLSNLTGDRSQDRFEAWLREISRAGIFLPGSVKTIRDHYRRCDFGDDPWVMTHGDAMPRNIIKTEEGIFKIVDEKYLFWAPEGVGLVKLSWDLKPPEFDILKEAYEGEKQRPLPKGSTHWMSLTFYYLIFSLACNAAANSWPENVTKPFFHWKRSLVMELIGLTGFDRWQEKLAWRAPYKVYRNWKIFFGMKGRANPPLKRDAA